MKPPGCVQLQSDCCPAQGGTQSQWSLGTGRTHCGPPRLEVQPGSAGLESPGGLVSLVEEKADPGGPGGAHGESGGRIGNCSRTAEHLGSVHHFLHFGPCEGCDQCVCPHSGFGSECSQCGKGVGCPCAADSDGAHLDRRLTMSRRQRSYQTLSSKKGVRARGPWRLAVTSQEVWAGHRGTCRSCCWDQVGL